MMPEEVLNENSRIILYDGVCKLCNGWSRFIIRVDKHRKFKLCSVQSESGQAILKHFGFPTDYFETMLLIKDGQALEKSDSFLEIMSELPWPWPWSWVVTLKLFPKKFRDWFYDRVALNRYRIFGKYDLCLMPIADHDSRFL